MTIGLVKILPAHRGELYIDDNQNSYALLNGQVLARSAYPGLAAYWPVGAYGSSDTVMVLPDLGESNHYQLRGHDFDSGFDPNLANRSVPSGSLPVQPSGVGTFQVQGMAIHTHPSGNQQSAKQSGIRDQGSIMSNNVTAQTNDLVQADINAPCVLSGTTAANLSFSTMGGYYYIRIK
jgi:hypothetical protein